MSELTGTRIFAEDVGYPLPGGSMPRGPLERIRAKIRQRQYDLSAHAMAEMAEELLDIEDVEQALLQGQMTRIDRDDPRGTKYVIEGRGADRRGGALYDDGALSDYHGL